MDGDTKKDTKKEKDALLHSIHETVGNSVLEQEILKPYTQEEKKMRLMMGLLVMVTGYFTIFYMGLPGIFYDDRRNSEIATFLVAFGMGIVLASSWYLYKVYEEKKSVGNIVFGFSFAASFFLLLFGLLNVYSFLGASIFLMIFGVIGASISAISLK